jgi:hypothetical protein
MPAANAETMSLHLTAIGRKVAPGSHAALVLDGAGYHIAAALTIPENITLVRLPPYAPELNPIENVWEYLRGNKLAITVFDDYDDIVDKACGAWNFFEQDPKRIASITPEHGQQSIFRAVGIRTYLRAVGPVLPGSAAIGRHLEHGLVFHRQLHRQIGRLLALKDAVDVGGGAASMAYLVRPI